MASISFSFIFSPQALKASGSNTDNSELTLFADAGGFVVAGCVYDYDTVGTMGVSWSGATEHFEEEYETQIDFSGASDIILSSSVAVKPTLDGIADASVFVAATF